jgi:hypothetical protein
MARRAVQAKKDQWQLVCAIHSALRDLYLIARGL